MENIINYMNEDLNIRFRQKPYILSDRNEIPEDISEEDARLIKKVVSRKTTIMDDLLFLTSIDYSYFESLDSIIVTDKRIFTTTIFRSGKQPILSFRIDVCSDDTLIITKTESSSGNNTIITKYFGGFIIMDYNKETFVGDFLKNIINGTSGMPDQCD